MCVQAARAARQGCEGLAARSVWAERHIKAHTDTVVLPLCTLCTHFLRSVYLHTDLYTIYMRSPACPCEILRFFFSTSYLLCAFFFLPIISFTLSRRVSPSHADTDTAAATAAAPQTDPVFVNPRGMQFLSFLHRIEKLLTRAGA